MQSALQIPVGYFFVEHTRRVPFFISLTRKVAMWAISLGVSLAPIRSNLRLLMDNDLGGAGAYCNHVDSWGYGG